MGLGDLNRRVVTTFVADVSNFAQGASDVATKAKEMGESIVEGAKQGAEGIKGLFDSLQSLQSTFEGVKKVGEFMWDGYKDSIRDAQLATASMGVDIEKLTAASHGLVTEHGLLEFSAKAMNSAFKNSQEDLETAQKAMLALERRGVSVADATNVVTEALVSGKTRGLIPYGIVIDQHIKGLQDMGEENMTLAKKEEMHAAALKSLATLSSEVVDGQDAQGESMKRSVTSVSNAWDDMKKAIGHLVEAMQPAIVALAKLVELAAKLVKNSADGEGFGMAAVANAKFGGTDGSTVAIDAFNEYNKIVGQRAATRASMASQDGAPEFDYESYAKDVRIWEEEKKKLAEAAKKQTEEFNRAVGLDKILNAEKEKRIRAADYASTGAHSAGVDQSTSAGGFASLSLGEAAVGNETADISTAFANRQREQGVELTKQWNQQIAALQKQDKTFLEKTFGKVDDFEAYKKAFSGLTSVATAGFDAWITGSESAGTAIKKALGSAIEAVANQMLVESLKNGAYALGALATGNAAAAAAYAAAAAEFAGGALIAGAIAKEMGAGGGASAGASGGASGGGSGSGGGGGAGGSSSAAPAGPIIVYSDSFAEDSPRNQLRKAKKMVALAQGSSSGMKNK